MGWGIFGGRSVQITTAAKTQQSMQRAMHKKKGGSAPEIEGGNTVKVGLLEHETVNDDGL